MWLMVFSEIKKNAGIIKVKSWKYLSFSNYAFSTQHFLQILFLYLQELKYWFGLAIFPLQTIDCQVPSSTTWKLVVLHSRNFLWCHVLESVLNPYTVTETKEQDVLFLPWRQVLFLWWVKNFFKFSLIRVPIREKR